MRPIFTVHAGEYLVASHIERRFKRFRVWVPSKDTGVDLLVTNPKKSKMVGLQVKFSKDFLPQMSLAYQKGLRSCGWWTLNQNKIKNSQADLWVFVLYSFNNRESQYLIISPTKLLSILKGIHGNKRSFNAYFWVTAKGMCWEARDLKKADQDRITHNQYTNYKRDMTDFLSNWNGIIKRLK